MNGNDYDSEAQRQIVKNAFSEQRIRRAFIRKVYTIVMFQLMVTLGAMAFVMFHDPTKVWIIHNTWMLTVAMVVMIITMLVITCFEMCRRQTPYNYILLGIFTISEAFLLSVLTLRFPSGVILLAIGTTTIVVFALTVFALQTRCDFTACGGILLIAGILFLIFGIVVMFFPTKTMLYVKASIGVVLFSVYLIFDTQLMLGGQHTYAISPEDYILAALSIYVDIIQIFVYILVLLGLGDN